MYYGQLIRYWPEAVLGILALAFIASFVSLIIIYHKKLLTEAREAWKRIFNRETLFWVVNITFMAFSAYHAAPFYASVSTNILGLEWFAPFVGITAALVLDALVIVFQQARKRSGYKHDRKRSRMYMWFIACCCGMNTIANMYTNYQNFNAVQYTNFWGVAIDLAPIVLSLFPLFIMALSDALEEMSSSSALDMLDVEAFKKDEEKRVSLIEAQAEYQQREVEADRKLIEIEKARRENDCLRRGKQPKEKRVFRLQAWLWTIPLQEDYAKLLEKATQEYQRAFDEASQNHSQNIEELRTTYDAQVSALTEQMASLHASLLAVQAMSIVPNRSRRSSSASHVDSSEQAVSLDRTPEPDTDEIPIVHGSDGKTEQKRPVPLFGKKDGNATRRKVRGLLKRNPEMGPTDIAKKAGISRSYASDLKDQVLKEMESVS